MKTIQLLLGVILLSWLSSGQEKQANGIGIATIVDNTTPTCSSSNLPTASSWTNRMFVVSNTAAITITLCRSNGTNWITMGGSSTASPTVTVTNAGTTGTTVNTLTKLTGAPSTAVITATTDTNGAVGVTTAGAGTTGSATIQYVGTVSLVFDGATTAGDYVTISSTTAGDGHDAGTNPPVGVQVLGRVLSTNASGGTYSVDLFPPSQPPTLVGTGLSSSSTAAGATLSANTAVLSTIAAAQSGIQLYCNSTTGNTNFACSFGASAALTAYTTGMRVFLVTDTSTTTGASLNIDTLGSKTITQADGVTPIGTNIAAGEGQWFWFDGTVFRQLEGSAGGSSSTFQVNGTGLSSSSTVNLENSSAFNGLTATFSNPSAGNVQLGFSGTLNNAGLTNPALTVNGTSCALGSSCAPYGGVNAYTSNHTIGASDIGKLVVMNCSLACTLTFESSPASTDWWGVESIGSSVATLSLNGKTFNGASNVPVLNNYRDLRVVSDGSNYFGDAPLAAGSNITLTPASNSFTILSSGGSGGEGVNPQTAAYTTTASDFSSHNTIVVASGTFTITLVANTSQPAAGQYVTIVNNGSGAITIARNGQNINGATTSLTLNQASDAQDTNSVRIWSDGTNYFAATITSSGPQAGWAVFNGGNPVFKVGTTNVQSSDNILDWFNNNWYLYGSGVEVASGKIYGMSSTTASTGTVDTAMSRGGAANVVAFGNGTAGDTSATIVPGLYGRNVSSAIASASTITPATSMFHVTGTTAINTITAPSSFAASGRGGCLDIIPDGAFTTGTSGNIAISSTAVVSKLLILCYDNATSKWYPSY